MFDVLEKTFIVGKAFESVDFYFFNILVAYRIEMWIERLLGMQMRGLLWKYGLEQCTLHMQFIGHCWD